MKFLFHFLWSFFGGSLGGVYLIEFFRSPVSGKFSEIALWQRIS
jgi:hypothetical protein